MPPEEPTGAIEHFKFVRRNANRVFPREGPSCQEVIAYLNGYDGGQSFATLSDFHEWLVVQHGGGYEFHWSGLVRTLALGHELRQRPVKPVGDDEDKAAALKILDLVVAYLEAKASQDGRRAIYRDFESLRLRDGLP